MQSRTYTYTLYSAFGLAMGAVLVLTGFADYDELHAMLQLQNLRLLFTFAGGLGLSALAFVSLHFAGYLRLDQKILHPGIVPGSVAFGFGWALTGACPSVMIAHLGQGKVPAVATVAGMVMGVYLYRYLQPRLLRWDTGTCGA